MRSLASFVQVAGWPVVFVALSNFTHETSISAVVVLALAFRSELSIILRSRRLNVKLPGFEGTVEDLEREPGSKP